MADIDITDASPEDIVKALQHDAEVVAAKVELAEKAAAYAKSIAPVETGAYRDNINVHQEGDNVWVGFDDEAANIIEYGNARTPEYAVRQKTEEHFNSDRSA